MNKLILYKIYECTQFQTNNRHFLKYYPAIFVTWCCRQPLGCDGSRISVSAMAELVSLKKNENEI